MKLLKWITSLFDLNSSYQAGVDAYVSSKHPKSVGEVEHLIKQYERLYQNYV